MNDQVILKPKQCVVIPYNNTPRTYETTIKVNASDNVNVCVVDDDGFESHKNNDTKTFPLITSKNKPNHLLVFNGIIDPGIRWYLIISNTSDDKPTNIKYDVYVNDI